ncbi:hypothetical protein EB796_016950 [Bugula neritina]|uniref:Uncharacterized protein n=1 Tax=Bugula neritina TaxID=10212 RepID=A0A7J7JEJ6_BUGNE|nr:hypothetical protein EB796_016950 [Bugula neritina]
MMRAIIIYDDVEDNKRNARSLDEAFRGRGFYVNHWQHVEWDADNLLSKLGQFCKEQNMQQLWCCALLMVYMMTYYYYTFQIIIIIDACQVEEGERGEEGDSENNVTTPNRESAASVQLQAAHVLITSSKAKKHGEISLLNLLLNN